MRLSRLLSALGRSDNGAADDTLLEALRLGNESEQPAILETLISRGTTLSHQGVLAAYADLPERLQNTVVRESNKLYHALSQGGRSPEKAVRIAAIRIIAASRQGKLGYVLSENLRDSDDDLSKAACDALLEMARWVHHESRGLQRMTTEDGDDLLWVGDAAKKNDSTVMQASTAGADLATAYAAVMRQRPEIESAIARALDWVRTKHLADLMRAALLLCDHPQSRILAILKTHRHGGQASMARKLQQPPAADHVEAFLLGASHGHLRANFAAAMAQSNDEAVFDALLRRTHWLGDNQLATSVKLVTRGVWWDGERIGIDLKRRKPQDAMRIADWVAASGLDDVDQDARLADLLQSIRTDALARLHVLRVVAARPQGASTELIKLMLEDEDERFVRIAARELIRRKPADVENVLLKRMTGGSEGVRRVIGRAIGHVGFALFWDRFDGLSSVARVAAGRAMLKLVPDAPARFGRYLLGTADERVRAMQAIDELGMAADYRATLERLCTHISPRVRSKAAAMLAGGPKPRIEILDRMLDDADARVRANAIEVVEKTNSVAHVPLLGQRTRSPAPRERANAIKALHGMGVEAAAGYLSDMLHDKRSEHRISALWALRQTGVWTLLRDVGAIAQKDDSVRVRRYAVALLKGVIDELNRPKGGPKKVA
ncbi:MAG: HEAT repeat domain-containing protein [Tepidisphaeraceae bacterium]